MKVFCNKENFVIGWEGFYNYHEGDYPVDVSDELAERLHITRRGFAWKYVNGTFEQVDTLTPEERVEAEKQILRSKRKTDCFPIVNRGQIWFNRLDEEQKAELDAWYTAWLDVTDTFQEPKKPIWLKE